MEAGNRDGSGRANMPGPRGKGCIGWRRAGAALCVSATIAFGTTAVIAQRTPELATGTQTPASSEQSASTGTAPELLDLARLNLTEKRTEAAQRLLEQLVARFPEAPEAERARAELLALYLRNPRIASAPPAPAQNDMAHTAPPASPSQSPPPASAWRISLILAPTLQDELRDSVGDRVFFAAGSTELGARARSVIAAQAQWLARHPELDAIVEGHADDADAGGDDNELSLRRAEAMLSQLVLDGVEPNRLRVHDLGSQARVATCNDSDCAAQNRRAVLRIGARAPIAVEPAKSDGLPSSPTAQTGAQR